MHVRRRVDWRELLECLKMAREERLRSALEWLVTEAWTEASFPRPRMLRNRSIVLKKGPQHISRESPVEVWFHPGSSIRVFGSINVPRACWCFSTSWRLRSRKRPKLRSDRRRVPPPFERGHLRRSNARRRHLSGSWLRSSPPQHVEAPNDLSCQAAAARHKQLARIGISARATA